MRVRRWCEVPGAVSGAPGLAYGLLSFARATRELPVSLRSGSLVPVWKDSRLTVMVGGCVDLWFCLGLLYWR